MIKKGNLQIIKLNNMYKDISILENKIALYYLDYGNLPIKQDKKVNFKNSINPNDNEIYYEIDLNKILYISDNYTVISGTGKISKIDIASNEIETIYCDSYEVKNGHAVIKEKNELLASTIEDFKFEKIMDLSNVSSRFDYYIHNVNDKPYLQIIDQTSSVVNGQYINTNSLTYYDFESGSFYELIKFEDNKSLSIDPNNTGRFMLGEPKLVGYNGYTPDDKHLEYELFVDNKGNKISELKQEFDDNRRLRSGLVGYWEAGSWVQEFTEYAYDSDGRLASEKTGYVGTDFYVITTYSDYDPWGNWCRSEIRDQGGVPYTFSLRRFSYFD